MGPFAQRAGTGAGGGSFRCSARPSSESESLAGLGAEHIDLLVAVHIALAELRPAAELRVDRTAHDNVAARRHHLVATALKAGPLLWRLHDDDFGRVHCAPPS